VRLGGSPPRGGHRGGGLGGGGGGAPGSQKKARIARITRKFMSEVVRGEKKEG